MKSESHLVYLLRCIHQGTSTDALLERGLRFSQIARLLSVARNDGLIVYGENDKLVLTAEAHRILAQPVGKDGHEGTGWIDAMDSERTTKVDKLEVYLPNRRVIAKLLSD